MRWGNPCSTHRNVGGIHQSGQQEAAEQNAGRTAAEDKMHRPRSRTCGKKHEDYKAGDEDNHNEAAVDRHRHQPTQTRCVCHQHNIGAHSAPKIPRVGKGGLTLAIAATSQQVELPSGVASPGCHQPQTEGRCRCRCTGKRPEMFKPARAVKHGHGRPGGIGSPPSTGGEIGAKRQFARCCK